MTNLFFLFLKNKHIHKKIISLPRSNILSVTASFIKRFTHRCDFFFFFFFWKYHTKFNTMVERLKLDFRLNQDSSVGAFPERLKHINYRLFHNQGLKRIKICQSKYQYQKSSFIRFKKFHTKFFFAQYDYSKKVKALKHLIS